MRPMVSRVLIKSLEAQRLTTHAVGIMGVTSDIKYVHLPMEKGDTIFFHPLLW